MFCTSTSISNILINVFYESRENIIRSLNRSVLVTHLHVTITLIYSFDLYVSNMVYMLNANNQTVSSTATLPVGGQHPKIFVFDFDCTLTYSHWYSFIHNYDNWTTQFLPQNPSQKPKPEQTIVNNLRKVSTYLLKFIAHNSRASAQTLKSKIARLRNTPIYGAVLTYIMGGTQRRNVINTFIETLVKNGHEVAIASRGYQKDIVVFLALMRIKGISKINAQHDCVYENNVPIARKYTNKEDLIKNLLMSQSKYTTVCYIDDDPTEHNKLLTMLNEKELTRYKYYGAKEGSNTIVIDLETNGSGLTKEVIDTILEDNNIENLTNKAML